MRTFSPPSHQSPAEPVFAGPHTASPGIAGEGGWPCLSRIVEAVADRTPDAVAIRFDGRATSYAELNAQANRIAHHLLALGIGRESIVAVCLRRSPDLLATLLGILKTGAAYLPLDPGAPAVRTQRILADAGAHGLVTDGSCGADLATASTSIVDLAAEAAAIAAARSNDPGCALAAGDLAYVIYTSGSTGLPKGVMVERRSLLCELAWQLDEFAIGRRDIVLQRTPVFFDGAVLSLWAPLLVGATVVMLDEEGMRDPREIAHAVRVYGITLLTAVPSLFAEILAEFERDKAPASLRCVVAGGEPLRVADARRWAAISDAALYNVYGPTECTVDSTFHRCTPGDAGVNVPIGRPTAGTVVHILDSSGNPVPAGETGEICIGGEGVARGYLGRSELTAQRFVPDPFGTRPGARMYRTGDLGRVRPDGLLEFAGRADEQIKYRGYRIEPGEIEAALLACPGVAAAAVALRGRAGGMQRLVAYVVRDRTLEGLGTPADSEAIQAGMEELLPAYMVPSIIVELAALPCLPNGKLDRKALPEPALPTARAGADAPHGPVEQALAQVWCAVLGVEACARDDDFFALGGNSLLAARANARIRARLGADLPLRAFFESPRLADLAARIAAAGDGAGDRGPERGDPAALAPVTDGQQAMLFLHRDGAGAAYNVVQATRIRGALDAAALKLAVAETLARHRALRTALEETGGQVRQRVRDDVVVEVDGATIAGATPAARRAAGDAALRALAATRFDPAVPPLARAVILRLEDDEHLLGIAVHHLVTDGWSMGILAAEIGARYSALRAGRRFEPAVSPIEYADYARWCDMRPVPAPALAYWSDRLRGVEPLILPNADPPAASDAPAGGCERFSIGAPLSRQIEALARRCAATPFMLLLAAYQVLLMRYSGQRDFAVGTPVACRDRLELEPVVGYFVNVLALRTDVDGNPSFDEYLARMRRHVLDAFAHREVPFGQVVASLRLPRIAGSTPVFQASFALQNMPPTGVVLPGLACTSEPVFSGKPKFALALALHARDDGLHGDLEYAGSCFDAASARRFATRFVRLLEAIVANPGTRLDALDLMAHGERDRILTTWNETDAAYPDGRGLSELFASVVRRSPGALAVLDDRERVDYATLDARANRLAHHLRNRGAGPGTIVAFSLPRGVDLVVTVLAIVKAGAAYLPLDETYPPQRLAHMVSDASPVLLVVEADAPVGIAAGRPIVRLRHDAAEIASCPHSDPAVRTAPDELVYVIYTSGSTGRPKGVMVAQRGVVRLVCGSDYFRPSSRECIAQASNVSFDAATFEIWGALLNGAALSVVGRDTVLSPRALDAQIRRDGITTMFVTTALFNAHAASAPDAFRALHTLMFGGEAADAGAVRRVLEAGAPRRLLNVYGPTETTTFATWHEISPQAGSPAHPSGSRVPIGRPIANTRCYVLDESMRPVPIGMVGELFIGGPGVAIGYLGNPEASERRFVADPFSPAGKLYRTGDRVRWREEGALEFIGRVDGQVKLRGFRIEPDEISSALRACRGVVDAVALVERAGSPDARLVAFAAGEGLDPDALLESLRQCLPAYTLPARVHVLDVLPVNVNGKVDRAVLLTLAQDAANAGSGRRIGAVVGAEAPLTAVGARVLALWRDVLDQPELGPDDDFFSAGGHSLLAVRMLAEVERAFGRVLLPSALLGAPTARRFGGLLASVDTAPASVSGGSTVIGIRAAGSAPPLFLMPGYGGGVLAFEPLARALGTDMSLYVLDVGALEPDALANWRLEDVAARMVSDIRAVQPEGPYSLAGFSLGGMFVYEIAQQLLAAGASVRLLCLLDVAAPGYPRRRTPLGTVLAALRRLGRGRVGGFLPWWKGLRQARANRRFLRRGTGLFAAEASAVADASVARRIQSNANQAYRMWAAYQPGPYHGTLTLLAATVRHQSLRFVDDDPKLGWDALASGGVIRFGMACEHEQMLDPGRAPELAELLQLALDAAPPLPARSRLNVGAVGASSIGARRSAPVGERERVR